MRSVKLVVSTLGAFAFSVYMVFFSGNPITVGSVIFGFTLGALAGFIAIYIALTLFPFFIGGPGRGPVQPTRTRDSLPYNSSNDPKRY